MSSPKAEVVPHDLTHFQQKRVPTFGSCSDQLEGHARFVTPWCHEQRLGGCGPWAYGRWLNT